MIDLIDPILSAPEEEPAPPPTLEELRNKAMDARQAAMDLKNQRDAERRKAIREFEEKLDREVIGPKYDKLWADARKATYEAEEAVTAEQDRLALASGDEAPFPLGTQFVEWERTYRHGPLSLRNTQQIAVLEVFTSQSLSPVNLRYAAGSVGEFVLRVLKKDGTPSARYIRPSWASVGSKRTFHYDDWFPVGFDPNEKKAGEGR